MSESVGIVSTRNAELLAGIHKLTRTHTEDFDIWSESAFAKLIQQPGTKALVAAGPRQDGLGLVLFRQAADEAEIILLSVLTNKRRMGIGRALLRDAMAAVKSSGAGRMLLEVEKNNAAAIGLYEKAGFEIVGQREAYYPKRSGTREDGLIMSVKL